MVGWRSLVCGAMTLAASVSCTDRVPEIGGTTGAAETTTTSDSSDSASASASPAPTGDALDVTSDTLATAASETGETGEPDPCAGLGVRGGEVLWAETIAARGLASVNDAVARPGDAGFYLAGGHASAQGEVVAISGAGRVEWQMPLPSLRDGGAPTHLAAHHRDGSIALGGTIYEPPVGTELQVGRFWLSRLSSKGAVDWTLEPASRTWDQETLGGLVIDDDGSILVVARSVVHGVRLRRFLPDGTEGASETLVAADGATLPEPNAVASTSDGDIVIAGTIVGADYQRWAARFTRGGRTVWTRTWTSDGFRGSGHAYDLAVLDGDRLAIGGRVGIPDAASDAWVALLDTEGDVSWETSWGVGSNDMVWGVAAGPGGEVVTAGFRGPGPDQGFLASGHVRVFEPDGTPRWEAFLGGGRRHLTTFFSEVAVVNECELIAIGETDAHPIAARLAL